MSTALQKLSGMATSNSVHVADGQNSKSALLCTGEVPWKEKGGGGGEAGHRLPCVEEEDGCGPLFLQSWCHYTAKGSFMRRRKEEKPDAQAERRRNGPLSKLYREF